MIFNELQQTRTMHQGKELRELAEKQRHIGKFAKEIGVSRDTLYKLFKRQTIPSKYVEVLRAHGVAITTPDSTKSYSGASNLLRGGGGGNGSGNHITKSQISNRNLTPPNSISVASVISLSLEELFKLQRDQDDPELLKTVNLVIQLKKDIKALENENKLLKENIQDLRKK